MKTTVLLASSAILFLSACAVNSGAGDKTVTEPTDILSDNQKISDEGPLCLTMGPQTPRDITSRAGTNPVTFPFAPPASEMNLCNIHAHLNAEHKGPGFSVFVNDTDFGGYACNETDTLTAAELAPAPGAFKGAKPGDTVEVHWVHTSCNAEPGQGLGACVPEGCEDPLLRVEAQTFLLVNDSSALNFMDMDYSGAPINGLHQAKMIPSDTGSPVTFLGSTTGPAYTQSVCSPAKVTWNVRPACAKLDINSLHAWAEDNAFEETEPHGVRQLVTAPELLSEIQ